MILSSYGHARSIDYTLSCARMQSGLSDTAMSTLEHSPIKCSSTCQNKHLRPSYILRYRRAWLRGKSEKVEKSLKLSFLMVVRPDPVLGCTFLCPQSSKPHPRERITAILTISRVGQGRAEHHRTRVYMYTGPCGTTPTRHTTPNDEI